MTVKKLERMTKSICKRRVIHYYLLLLWYRRTLRSSCWHLHTLLSMFKELISSQLRYHPVVQGREERVMILESWSDPILLYRERLDSPLLSYPKNIKANQDEVIHIGCPCMVTASIPCAVHRTVQVIWKPFVCVIIPVHTAMKVKGNTILITSWLDSSARPNQWLTHVHYHLPQTCPATNTESK